MVYQIPTFEIRFAPQIHAVPGTLLSVEQVLQAVNAGLLRAMNEYNQHEGVVSKLEPEYFYGIIVCAMWFFPEDFSPYYKAFWHFHEHEGSHRIYGLASMALVTTAYNMKKTLNIPIVALDVAGAENETIPTDTTHCQLTSTIIKFNDDGNNEVEVPIEAVLVSWDVELLKSIQ
jgi:hypothetical protein